MAFAAVATAAFTGLRLAELIQAILRHSDIATTLSFYVETPEAESREALDKLMVLMK